MKRIVSLWLPLFATDRRSRPGKPLSAWRHAPLATLTRIQGGVRIAGANAAAEAAGVVPGLPAADATALCPGLKTAPAAPAADARALAALAEWCRRWSPWTAPEGDRGIWIDATGCAHLFGGEQALLDDVAGRIAGLGFAVRAGLADTPGAAWAVARFGEGATGLLPEGSARQLLAGYPVAALRLPPDVVATLARLGLRRIADLTALPRAPLAARFGAVVGLRLDQLLGRVPEPLSPLEWSEPLFARLAFAEPIGRSEDVAAAIHRLLADLEPMMERRGVGARRLTLRLFRVDGVALARDVGTSAPVRAPGHLARLFAESLDSLDAGFGIESMTMMVTSADPLDFRQEDIESRPTGDALPLLVDRLARRLGPAAVFRVAPAPTHCPERLCAKAAPLSAAAGAWPDRRRPVRLPPHPRPARVDEADGVPVRLGNRALVGAEGPERIAAEWWHGAAPPSPQAHRDYWRAEDERGRRWWLFKDGAAGTWFVQGEFG